MTTRRLFIAGAAVVLAAGVVAGRERPALELLPERAPQAPAPATDGIDLERLRRGESSRPQVDPFAKKDFENRATKSARTMPAKPVTPALPFQYFGRLSENGKTEVFVMRGDELLSIAPGQTLGEYRVDSIGDTGIAFTYLPLKTTQRLDFQ